MKKLTKVITFLALHAITYADSVINEQLAQLEKSNHGRLGVYAIDSSNNQIISYRGNQLFPFCSTSKLLAVATILKQSESQANYLQKTIKYSQADVAISGYSPVTKHQIESGMTIQNLCAAALEYSDNTAMNQLIKAAGGINSINSFAKAIGNSSFALTRMEPQLNTALPNDKRDTVTPQDMSYSLQNLVLGNALSSNSAANLANMLKNNTTGAQRIRAGVAKNWVVADKTGSGAYGTTNDIGIIYPPNCQPLVISVYFTQFTKNASYDEAVIANVTKAVVAEFAKHNKCLTD